MTTYYLDKTGTAKLAELCQSDATDKADAALTSAKEYADSLITGGDYVTTTALEAYGYQTADDVSSAISSAIVGVYTVKGSTTFAALTALTDMSAGDVYNVTDAFETTTAFVEGEGASYPAGTNVVYTDSGWDCLTGIIDLSDYALTSDFEAITTDEIEAMFASE